MCHSFPGAAKAIQEKDAKGHQQDDVGPLAGPFPVEAAGSFPGLLVKGKRYRGLSSTRAEFGSVEISYFKDKKGGASNWRRSRIPEPSPPSSSLCS